MPLANISDIVRRSSKLLTPVPHLRMSEYADEYFYVTKGGSTGKWRTRPYQKEILDCWTDPKVWRTSIMKSARVGYTTLLNISETYSLHYDPCDSCTVQATTEYAEKYSRDTFSKIRDRIPALQELFADSKYRDGTDSLLEKRVNGGSLSFLGANSPNGFRGWTYRVARADEVDAYPLKGAGEEGDQIELLLNRTIDYPDRVFIEGSTPLKEETSRILQSFLAGDQRRRFLPCPHCGHFQYLRWREKGHEGGFHWSPGDPSSVVYLCESCLKPIRHRDKWEMDKLGEWRPCGAANIGPDGREHRSYHIWAAYSYQANATWSHIVYEYEKTKKDASTHQTFINTWIGIPWKDEIQAKVSADGLMARRGTYLSGQVPDGVLLLTLGCDVQDDRLEVSVWGWGRGSSSIKAGPEPEGWLIQHAVIERAYVTTEAWEQLSTFLTGKFPRASGVDMTPLAGAIDSGDGEHSPYVFDYVNKNKQYGAIAVKGSGTEGKPPIGRASTTEFNFKDRPSKTAAQFYMVGTDVIKSRLAARLKYNQSPGPGYLNFPADTTEEYFKQLVSEDRKYYRAGGSSKYKWERKKGVRAETLDCFVYAYAALQHARKRFNPNTMWDQLEVAIKEKEAVLQGNAVAIPVKRSPVAFNLLDRS